MARKASNSMSSRLTRFETIAGWLYLPFYLIILNLLLQLANEKLSLGMSALTINIAYFAINLAATLLIFHGFLRQSYFGGSFWNFVQALILGFALYYAGTWAVQALEHLLAGQVTIYNNETVNDLIFENRYVMLAVSVIFAPVIEETLVRGVVFGTIRPASRVLAYIVSALLFTLMHNWQYFGLYPALSILLSCLPYIPASVALAWVYEKGGTIWAPITLHALINAMSFGLLTLS